MNRLRDEITPGGRAWRRLRGLETISDLARRYRARRFTRPGALCPLPEDLLPRWIPTPTPRPETPLLGS